MDLLPKDLIRFWIKVEKTGSCWEWTSVKTHDGYGQFSIKGKKKYSHRVSYELFKGDIPEGLQLDHLCRNRSCVNPDHLEPVTQQENMMRGVGLALINKRKTHCLQGHEYSEKNTYLHKNGRNCRECDRIKHNRNNRLKQNSLYQSK